MIAPLLLALVSMAPPPRAHVIVVSYDSFNERRVTATLGARVPTFQRLATEGACADGARPMYPSLTAASHAAIWTGTYGNRNGIAGNRPQLPRGTATTAATTGDGFRYELLDAEPAWIALARQGRTVVGLHVTQAPFAPGYPWRSDSVARRAEAARALARPGAIVLNGFNARVAAERVLTEAVAPPHDAPAWRGRATLPADAPAAREISWALTARDSAFALLTGRHGRYTRMLVAVGTRDVARAVDVTAHEAAPAAPGEPLARWWSRPVPVATPAGRVFPRWRLFVLAPDGSRFVLAQPELLAVEANRPEVAAAHDRATAGFVGHAMDDSWARGELGATYRAHGDGTAERRLVETVELAVRSAIAGAEWGWRAHHPDALFTYLSVGDGIDHAVWSEADPTAPLASDSARAAAARELRGAIWALADRHLAALRALARTTPNTTILVTGDHGMRASWHVARVNVALAGAGLLVPDAAGRLEGARSRVLSPNGYWLTVNTTERGGPVPEHEAAAVLDSAAAVLSALRDASGAPVLPRLRRPEPDDSLGMGGPAGGDLYWDVARGWRVSADLKGPALSDDPEPSAGHGFTSTDEDMQTALCAWGRGLAPRRVGRARVIDVMPTAFDLLGANPPRDATGRSIRQALRGTHATTARIDHVILAVPELSAGIAELARRTGITAVRGGVHPGRGTQNALMSLGAGTYLELLAPSGELPDTTARAASLRSLPGPTPFGFAIGTDDLAATSAAVRAAGIEVSDPIAGARRTTAGDTLHWQTAGLGLDPVEEAPFVIQWDAGTRHPSSTSPTGCRLQQLEQVTRDARRFAALVRALHLPITVRPGARESLRIVLDCPGGVVRFGD